MLKTIIIHEIQEYIKSKKLLIGLFITLVLVTVTTVINTEDYSKRQQDYLDAKREMRFSLGKYHLYRPPQVLGILIQGKDHKLGNRIDITDYSIPFKTTGYRGARQDQHRIFMARFSVVDYAFIVKTLLSLLVFFLTYNTVSEEKIRGTLKITLANNLPRDILLLGKCISGLLVIYSSLFIASIISLLIIIFHPAVSLGFTEWVRVLGIIGISALYLTVFYMISLLISVKTNRPSTTLIVLLQLWFFLIIIYPNAGVIIANKYYSLSSDKEISSRKEAITQSYEGDIQRAYKVYQDSQFDEINYTEFHKILIQRAESWYYVDHEFFNELLKQTKLAQNISVFSPSVLFDRVIQRYANTDITNYERFIHNVFNYWKNNIASIHSQKFAKDIDYNIEIKQNLPEFTHTPEKFTKSFFATTPNIIILFLSCIMIYTLAHVSFLRKDVR